MTSWMMENFFISESSAVVVRLLLVLLAEMSFWFNIDKGGRWGLVGVT